jgi:tetratricopeptide (TPR) repeat protein
MGTRKFFNVFYFVAALGVFGWMLRDNPHWRAIPILSLLACGFYGMLAIVAILKPNGFAVSQGVFSAKKARCLRRWALLVPIPALAYFGLYSACMEHAGEWRCLNKLYTPIARFEKASFSRNRMVTFIVNTHPRLLSAAMQYEQDHNWKQAESYYKAATSLENKLADSKLPTSYTILACLYDRMGRHDKAERMYVRAEELANMETCRDGLTCNHMEMVSVPHMIAELDNANIDQTLLNEYPWLVADSSEVPSNILGRQFFSVNKRSLHSHNWFNFSKCGHKCRDHKDCDHDKMQKNVFHFAGLTCNDKDHNHPQALSCNDDDHDHALASSCNDKHKAVQWLGLPGDTANNCDKEHDHDTEECLAPQYFYQFGAPEPLPVE